MVKEFIENNLENFKKDLGELVSYHSVLSDDEAPFGSENRKVLDAALKMMEEKGFRTENVDYYCGYGEVGKGEEVIGILAHLDVVPEGDGWDSDPYQMIEKDGWVYGRGVSDDKGPAVASMYAIKYLLDTGYPFKRRVRLILGCNEETGSACIRHYVEKKGHVDMGYTPDGGFPGIIGEKGMVGGLITTDSSSILELKGGDASNIVCKNLTCVLKKGSVDKEKMETYFNNHGVGCRWEEDENITITLTGKAAHASTPDNGINAINHLFEALYEAGMDDVLVTYMHKYFGLDLHGERLGMEELKDELSDTSINLGVANTKEGRITISLDMRFPVKSHVEDVMKVLSVLNEEKVWFEAGRGVEPLYFDKNNPMIKALKKAYEDVTGDHESEMEVIGGGTYAKAIHNCIAFGADFGGEEVHMHDANEKLNLESVRKQIEIYIEAIRNLNEV